MRYIYQTKNKVVEVLHVEDNETNSVTIDSIVNIYGQNFNLICTYINFSNEIHENIALFLQVKKAF